MSKSSPSKLFLSEHITASLNDYFSTLEDGTPNNLHQLVLTQVEIPLLKIVMHYTQGNQSRAAEWLGLSRGTLRKLLSRYELT